VQEMANKGLVSIGPASANRVELKLLNNTRSRTVLEYAMQRVDEIIRFECVEPSLNEIFVSAVEQQKSVVAA
ncbi:MAG: DUF4162 domain-containing protein, partial [Bacteroidota bacterium]